MLALYKRGFLNFFFFLSFSPLVEQGGIKVLWHAHYKHSFLFLTTLLLRVTEDYNCLFTFPLQWLIATHSSQSYLQLPRHY